MPDELLIYDFIIKAFRYIKALAATGISNVVNNFGLSRLKLSVINHAIITNTLPKENHGSIAKIKPYISINFVVADLKSTVKNIYNEISEHKTSML